MGGGSSVQPEGVSIVADSVAGEFVGPSRVAGRTFAGRVAPGEACRACAGVPGDFFPQDAD
jgi:hypothetical protein